VQEGELLTVVSWGAMVERCVLAADDLGGSIEIIDLRTIQPWDRETVLASVRKTAKLLVVHEDIEFGGFGAEVVAHVINEAFLDMDGPPQRLGAPQVLTPFSTTLMAAMIPTVEQIRDKMDWLLRY
jgi:2-oxoisovalerate dehydrogenase E1 component